VPCTWGTMLSDRGVVVSGVGLFQLSARMRTLEATFEEPFMLVFLFKFHSGLRWLIALGAIYLLLQGAMAWLGKRSFSVNDDRVTRVFIGLIDVQLLLGLILFGWMGVSGIGFPFFHVEHAVIMIAVAALAHMLTRWKAEPAVARGRAVFLVLSGMILLIIVGVSRLPQGW
jgi:hypothetical protein